MIANMDKIQFEHRDEVDHLLSIMGESMEKGIIADNDEVAERFFKLLEYIWLNW